MRTDDPLRSVALGVLATAIGLRAPAQERLPVPEPAARAQVQGQLLELLAQWMAAPASEPDAVPWLLEHAAGADRPPALRFELYEHAQRCAFAQRNAAAGFRAADALATAFAVDGARAHLLARFEADGRVPAQLLVGALLDSAVRALAAQAPDIAGALSDARRLAAVDQPRGLQALVTAACGELEQAQRARERVLRDGTDPVQLARFRAFYLGDWQPALAAPPADGSRFARTVGSKIEARQGPGDIVALARAAEEWLSQGQREVDSLARRHLQRRAMKLLLPLARYQAPATEPGTEPAPAPLVEAVEVERVRRLLDRATGLAAEPVVGALRFDDAAGLDRLLIDGGEWRIEPGLLVGRSLGPDVATRATARFAFRRIDSVTIRGGIRSDAGLNFRVAVGPVNVLLNWEVADQNHFYFGDHVVPTQPRLLTAGREHTIVLRQCDDEVAVFVDGQEVAHGTAQLAGTVCVYPAIGSEIFVRSIDVVGDVDLARVVDGPGPTH